MIEKLSKNPRILFLIDGLGAVLSALLYIFVLANLVEVFGMQKKPLYILFILASLYAFISFSTYFRNVSKWRGYLTFIASANLLHCCLTLVLIFYFFSSLTGMGLLYFSGEIIIVTSLALLELKIARNSASL